MKATTALDYLERYVRQSWTDIPQQNEHKDTYKENEAQMAVVMLWTAKAATPDTDFIPQDSNILKPPSQDVWILIYDYCPLYIKFDISLFKKCDDNGDEFVLP